MQSLLREIRDRQLHTPSMYAERTAAARERLARQLDVTWSSLQAHSQDRLCVGEVLLDDMRGTEAGAFGASIVA